MVNYNLLKDLSVKKLLLVAKDYLDANEKEDALSIISLALDKEHENPQVLFVAATIFLKCDKEGIAEVFYRRALEFDPKRSEIWGGVGRAIDGYTRPEEKIKYLKKALQLNPKNDKAMVNLTNAYLLDSQWGKALEWADKTLEVAPKSIGGRDNRGMAKLALGDWTGWEDCLAGLGQKYRLDVQYCNEPRWDGSKDKELIIYGAQGLGDEILYGSCIPDAISDCSHVIVDCDKRLESLFKRSFPQASVYGTRRIEASWLHHHTWDASCSIDVLPVFYRNKDTDFPGKPFLKACPVRRKQWRHTLDEMSDRPKIGIAWFGGGKLTARENRSVPVETFNELAEYGDLIDLEYEKHDHNDVPITRFDFATLSQDYDDTAALVAELDYVVTVCTAMVHLCGGLGVECHVLLPEKPSWRYAYKDMIWYDSVHLHTNIDDIKETLYDLRTNRCDNPHIRGISAPGTKGSEISQDRAYGEM